MSARPLLFCGGQACFRVRWVLDCGAVFVCDGECGVGAAGDALGGGVEFLLKLGVLFACCFSPNIAAVPW